jgi:hypothetical protein
MVVFTANITLPVVPSGNRLTAFPVLLTAFFASPTRIVFCFYFPHKGHSLNLDISIPLYDIKHNVIYVIAINEIVILVVIFIKRVSPFYVVTGWGSNVTSEYQTPPQSPNWLKCFY